MEDSTSWSMPVDLAELAETGETALVREIFEMFLEDTQGRMTTLASAIETGNSGAVSNAGHSLKGGCAQVGARRLAEIAAGWEEPGQTAASWRGRFALFRKEFDRVRSLILAHAIWQVE